MPVLPDQKASEPLFAATLSHEMKTPLAALQAAAASLRRNLQALVGSPGVQGASGAPLAGALPLIRAALSDPRPPLPPTGLAAERRIAETAVRLRQAGFGGDAHEAAGVIVRGGWETGLDDLSKILARPGAETLLPLLETVGKIRSNLKSVDASIERLLMLAAALRVGLTTPAVTLAPFDLKACIEDALATLRHAVPPGTEVEMRCAEGIRISGSAGQIQQVVTNLVGNALAAVPERGGRVVVEAVRTPTEVVVGVEDNGVGIPEEARAEIFTPFFTTKPSGQGVGLGLFVSRRIVESHGGTLTFASRSGATRFEIRFPRGGVRPASPQG